MSIPPPDERYTWPTQPAGARRARREAVQRAHADLQPGSPAMTRRQGVVAGTVFAVAAVWGPVFRGVEVLLLMVLVVALFANMGP